MQFMYSSFLILFLILLTHCSFTSHDKNVLSYETLANKKILILGDSITQNGRYVSYLDYFLQQQKPDFNYNITSIGLSSETVSGISESHHPFPRPSIHYRLERALTEIKPSVLMVCYGMNDGIYHPLDEDISAQYQTGIDKLITAARNHGVKSIILNAPPYFDSSVIKNKTQAIGYKDYGYKTPYENYNESLKAFGLYLAKLAQENNDISYIDLNTPMANYTHQHNEHLNKDGIHPHNFGHFFIASIILKQLGIVLPQDELKSKFHAIEQSELFKLIHERRELNSTSWLNYIGYTRGNKTIKSQSIDTEIEKIKQLQEKIDKLKISLTHD